jgi:hypothetical protein
VLAKDREAAHEREWDRKRIQEFRNSRIGLREEINAE